jgi:hypothetical protein
MSASKFLTCVFAFRLVVVFNSFDIITCRFRFVNNFFYFFKSDFSVDFFVVSVFASTTKLSIAFLFTLVNT